MKKSLVFYGSNLFVWSWMFSQFFQFKLVKEEDEIPGSLLKKGTWLLVAKWLSKNDLKSTPDDNLSLFAYTDPFSMKKQIGIVRATERELIKTNDTRMVTRVNSRFPSVSSQSNFFDELIDSKREVSAI